MASRIKSRTNFIKKIIVSLRNGEKTLLEISKEVYKDKNFYDKKVVEKYLKELTDVGIIKEEHKEDKIFYSLDFSYNKNTYFGLPLNESQEKNIFSLFFFIRKFSKRKIMLHTLIQKTIFEISEKYPSLNIPVGWYLYGATSVAIFEEDKEYKNEGVLSEEIIKHVKSTVEKYSKYTSAFEIKKKHYENFAPPIYTIKENILKNMRFLLSEKQKVYVLEDIILLLNKFLKEIKIKEGFLSVYEYFSDYKTLTKDIYNHIKKKYSLDESFFLEYFYLFKLLWRLYALTQFREDLKKYYSEDILNQRFNFEIKQQEEEIEDLGLELQSMIPIEENEKKLREAVKKIKLK